MAAPVTHPYSVDVRSCRTVPGRFVWAVNERHGSRRRSPESYPTFEDARIAAKATLTSLIAEWQPGGAMTRSPERPGAT